jgi:TonB family protein
MIREIFKRIPGCTVLWILLTAPQVRAFENPKTFSFVNSSYIITAELSSEHTFVVNFINLSDFVTVVQPGDFIYRSASGLHYIGQVYELEHKDLRGEIQKYSASILIKAHSFEGLNIVGQFLEQDHIDELSIRIGGGRFYLEPMEKIRFEELVRKIESLDLASSNVTEMFQEANIQETGRYESTDGSPEWDRDWEGLITEDGINPPRALENPPVTFPEDARKSRQNREVRVSCLITKNGGIRNLKVIKGIDRDLDQRAMDGVANRWIFLPATKNGEVYETAFEFNVGFIAPEETP